MAREVKKYGEINKGINLSTLKRMEKAIADDANWADDDLFQINLNRKNAAKMVEYAKLGLEVSKGKKKKV